LLLQGLPSAPGSGFPDGLPRFYHSGMLRISAPLAMAHFH
jgi:hypothetical protein